MDCITNFGFTVEKELFSTFLIFFSRKSHPFQYNFAAGKKCKSQLIMQRGEYSITTVDGVNLHFRYWNSESDHVCLCIVHGWGMESSVYIPFAQYLAQQGVNVTAIDLRGHGNSAGKISKIRHMAVLDRDVEVLVQESERLFPESKKILMGHQIGALLALQYYLTHKKSVDALILSAPMFKPAIKILASWWFRIRLLSHIFPFFLIDVSKYLGITIPNDLLKSSDNSLPFMHVKLFCEVKRIGQKMITLGYKINVPTLVMHGTEDSIALHKSSVVFARNTGFYTTFKSWSGKGHYLTEKHDVEILEYLLNWIRKTVQPSSLKA